MFRTVFTPVEVSDLIIQLPEEYLRKQVEVIAFDVKGEIRPASLDKEARRNRIIKVIDNLPSVDFRDYKFNREEANER